MNDRKEGKSIVQTREDKKTLVKELHEKFGRAGAAFLADYQGIASNDMNELRRILRESDVEFRIIKNTLARRAVKETPYEVLEGHFEGPLAIALSYDDAALAAKRLLQFAKDQPNLKIWLGALGGKILDPAEIKGLAELPSREELLAKLLGVLSNVPGSLVGVLAGVPRKLLYALNAVGDAKQKAA